MEKGRVSTIGSFVHTFDGLVLRRRFLSPATGGLPSPSRPSEMTRLLPFTMLGPVPVGSVYDWVWALKGCRSAGESSFS